MTKRHVLEVSACLHCPPRSRTGCPLDLPNSIITLRLCASPQIVVPLTRITPATFLIALTVMDTFGLVSTVVGLVASCSHAAKRIYDLTGDAKASGEPILDLALEAMLLAETFERLESFLAGERTAGSANRLPSFDPPAPGTVDHTLNRIFRLCQMTLSDLSLELDKLGGSESGVLHLIAKAKLALRPHKMKEFLEHLRIYREALQFQVQILTLYDSFIYGPTNY